MRSTLLLAVLACSCEAWRVPAASAHATARRNQRTPALTPRRSALLMSEDGADDPVEAAPPPSAVRLFLARHATRYATSRATPHHMSMSRYHAPCLAPCHAPPRYHTTVLTHQAPKGPSGQGGMPTDFLGFLDVNTTFGSIAASLIVAGGFCVLVELVKFVDKSPSTPSVFGSLWS
jgi:hypothetical protein